MPRLKSTQREWKEKLKEYFLSLDKKDFKELHATLDKSLEIPIYSKKIFNTCISGGQRLILFEIVNNIPKKVRSVSLISSTDLSLFYELLVRNYKVYTGVRFGFQRILMDFISNSRSIQLEKVVRIFQLVKQIESINEPVKKDIEYLQQMQLFCKNYKDYFKTQGDLLYIDTPTIIKGKNFIQRYSYIDYCEGYGNNIIPFLYNDEVKCFKDMFSFSKDYKYVIFGHGSGDCKLEDKLTIAKKYFTNVQVIEKPFTLFTDYIVFCSNVKWKISKKLYYNVRKS